MTGTRIQFAQINAMGIGGSPQRIWISGSRNGGRSRTRARDAFSARRVNELILHHEAAAGAGVSKALKIFYYSDIHVRRRILRVVRLLLAFAWVR